MDSLSVKGRSQVYASIILYESTLVVCVGEHADVCPLVSSYYEVCCLPSLLCEFTNLSVTTFSSLSNCESNT